MDWEVPGRSQCQARPQPQAVTHSDKFASCHTGVQLLEATRPPHYRPSCLLSALPPCPRVALFSDWEGYCCGSPSHKGFGSIHLNIAAMKQQHHKLLDPLICRLNNSVSSPISWD